MSLILHRGAERVSREDLREVHTPDATDTHVPIPHHRLVDLVAHSVGYYGHKITQEEYGVTADGNRFFAVLCLQDGHTGYQDTVGLRNSHDKSLPVGIAFGSHVFVCDNLAFSAEHVIRAKHTSQIKTRLPGLIQNLIEPLQDVREAQAVKIQRYRSIEITEAEADHCIMTLYRESVITTQKIAHVWKEWDEPSFEEFAKEPRSLWRLFNSVTFVCRETAVERPDQTRRLHQVIDATAQEVTAN